MHNFLRSFMWITALLAAMPVQAAKVDTLKIQSACMQRIIKAVAIQPDKAVNGEKCPVIYLLHGYGDNETSYYKRIPSLADIADRDGIIFVCPNGETSWYWDSPVNKKYRFETFVSKELVEYVDKHLNTKNNRSYRAITGLSMGGHGAMWLAIRHKDVFGAVGSMSGGLDVRPFPNNWSIKDMLGEKEKNLDIWNNHTVINQLDKIQNNDLAIIFDCGNKDFFYGVNKAVHERLLEMKIDHDFIVRPGAHCWPYWKNSIHYQILFFKRFFEQNMEKEILNQK